MPKAPPERSQIDHVLAEETWEYPEASGSMARKKISVRIGFPEQHDAFTGEWLCPIFVEGFTDGVKCIVGHGPVGVLMNAMTWLRRVFDETHTPARR